MRSLLPLLLFAGCTAESTITVDLLAPVEVLNLAPGEGRAVTIAPGGETLSLRVNNNASQRAYCTISGCERSADFTVEANASTPRESVCQPDRVLELRCNGLPRIAFSTRAEVQVVDAGPTCRIEGLSVLGARDLDGGQFELPPLQPREGSDETGVLFVQTRGGDDAGCPLALSQTGSTRFSFSSLTGSASGRSYRVVFGPLAPDLDERVELTVTGPLNSRKLGIRARTWTLCPDLDAGACYRVPPGERWGTDGVTLARIEDGGVLSSRKELVRNDFSPMTGVRDLAIDSAGRMWGATRDSVCAVDPVSGVVRECWRPQLGELRGLGGFGDGGLVASATGSLFVLDPLTRDAGVLFDAGQAFLPGDVASDERGVWFATRGLLGDALRVLRPDGGMAAVQLGFTGVNGVMADGAEVTVLTDRGFVVGVEEDGGVRSEEGTVMDWTGGASRGR